MKAHSLARGAPPPTSIPAKTVHKPARSRTLLTYGLLVGFFFATALAGLAGIGAVRILFILGSFVVGLQAYRQGGLALHVQVAIALFVFSPLIRRLADLHLGYDSNGIMLVGPLLALVAVFPELRGLASQRSRSASLLMPHVIILGCLTYGWALSAFHNDIVQGSAVALKYVIPLLYCICLTLRPDQSSVVLDSAARAFLVVSPLMGVYGVLQHLNPQPWDRLWMIGSKIDSIGLPEPGKVRVFSTMNSPVSFATYATCGLLLFSFVRRTFIPSFLVSIFGILPLSLSLLLSGVRTAWISAAISLVVCLFVKRVRGRAMLLVASLGCGIAVALLFTSFGDVVSSRLSSLSGNVSSDGSGSARIDDYFHVFGEDSRYLFGVGFGSNNDRQMNALDGLLLSSTVQMGIALGVVQTIAVLWAGTQAISRGGFQGGVRQTVASALLIGDLAVFLLIAISVGEVGFLYWMLVGVLAGRPAPARQISLTAPSEARLQPRTSVPTPLQSGR